MTTKADQQLLDEMHILLVEDPLTVAKYANREIVKVEATLDVLRLLRKRAIESTREIYGIPYSQIGDALGLTRQRIHQIKSKDST